MSASSFKLTYATMFDPPEALHTQYEAALTEVRAMLGSEHAMMINNEDVYADGKFESRSPINTDWVLGVFQDGQAAHADRAVAAAAAAFKTWGRMPWQERIAHMRKAVQVIEERVYTIGAALSLEVGKNRMEALGDAQECADLIAFTCDQIEQHDGFVTVMGKDPLPGYDVTNVSVMRPYGVWGVISPFNFPVALTGGPAGTAMACGNTVVFKNAPETPWMGRFLAECFRDAGIPAGVFNYLTDKDSEAGKALVRNPQVSGVTFTGSVAVGMEIYRRFASGPYPRPVVAEMGGKNPAIVSASADLDAAAMGIVRSSFGLQGQKCSAASRILADASIKDALLDKVVALTREMVSVGDPTVRGTFMGPVINNRAYRNFGDWAESLSGAGSIAIGGRHLVDGALAKGYFCEPTVVDGVPYDHHLWEHEMFVPITMFGTFDTLDEAMALANSVDFGLTAGFYGSSDDANWFFDNIEAGVTYANRPQGATTGAWPDFQPFGGWKGSGSTGRNNGGPYYLLSYMHEQSRTIVRAA